MRVTVPVEKFSLAMAKIRVNQMSNKGKITLGPLSYQIWCVEAKRDDIDAFLFQLNNTTLEGVKCATRQETASGYVVSVVLDEEYNVQGTINRIKQIATGWARLHNFTITT